jgi:hypothetical protein
MHEQAHGAPAPRESPEEHILPKDMLTMTLVIKPSGISPDSLSISPHIIIPIWASRYRYEAKDGIVIAINDNLNPMSYSRRKNRAARALVFMYHVTHRSMHPDW